MPTMGKMRSMEMALTMPMTARAVSPPRRDMALLATTSMTRERHWTMAMGTPSLSIAAMVAALGASLRASILRTLLWSWMNQRVRAAPKAWAMTVAQAAPAMPQRKAKMKRGARIAFRTVPLMV